MPTNTDLVKDLPADFEIFGQAVDTQMKTNADLVIPKTIVDAKGDLIVASGADAVARLAVGTNDYVLTADSAATNGIKWAAAPSAIPANDTATVNTSQATSSSSYTDLATSGPAVTVTTGTKALVIITCDIESGSGTAAYVSYAVSGASSISATDLEASYSNTGTTRFAFHSVPTLTAGSNTFTVKYRSESGSKTFARRNIFVINLA